MGGGTDAQGSMDIDKGDISDYTPEELVRITNFVSMFGDTGVGALYTLESAHVPKGAHQLVVDALTDAIGDVMRTCGVGTGAATSPEDVHDAAPSLGILVDLWPEEMYLPDDFKISEQLLRKCYDKFYESVRVRVAKAVTEKAPETGTAE